MNTGNDAAPTRKKVPESGNEPPAPESELRDTDNKTRMVDDKLMGDDRALKDLDPEQPSNESDAVPENNY